MKKDENKNDGFDYSPRSRKKNKVNKQKKITTICSVIAGSIIAVCLIAFGMGYSMVNPYTIADGVYAANVNLSGLTLDEAKIALDEAALLTSHNIHLTNKDKSYTISTDGLQYSINTEETAKKAYSYGKSGNIFSKIYKAFNAKRKNIEILPSFIFDATQISEQLDKFGEEVCGVLKQHEVTIDNDIITVAPGVSGYDYNPSDALSDLSNAMSSQLENSIEVTFNTKAPDELTLEKFSEIISSSGLNAAFKIENGEVVITEGRMGYTFDESEAKEALKNVKEGGSPITISAQPIKPKYTAEELKQKLFNAELASYSTRYNAGQVNRSKNVAVAASKLNDVILLPGETLSFNSTVGKRTTANGFMPAPEYQNGQSVMGIGGGTCQVSTTLYSAVLYANLEVVSRRNHSMSVSYVPLGQDATVTDGGTDFKFKNNTEFPIKLKTSAGKGIITVKIIGTAYEPAIKVKIVNTKTSELSATTTRIIYDASGNEISRQVIANSKYKPHGSSESTESQPASTPTEAPAPSQTEAPTTQTPTVDAPVQNTQAPDNNENTVPEPSKTPEVVSTPKPETTPEPPKTEPEKAPVQEAPKTEQKPVLEKTEE